MLDITFMWYTIFYGLFHELELLILKSLILLYVSCTSYMYCTLWTRDQLYNPRFQPKCNNRSRKKLLCVARSCAVSPQKKKSTKFQPKYPRSWCLAKAWCNSHTVLRQINAPCVLTATLVNSRGSGVYYRGFSATFAHFWQIFTYFEGNIPPESAGARLFQQAHLFGKIR